MKKERGDLKQINLDAAGIDIGSEFHYVAVPEDRTDESIRKFGCYTADIEGMAKWLKECGIKTVAMESTGVYWIPVFQILEANGFEVLLVNARHIKNVSGRKTDIVDSRWIQQLHTYGLLQGSYQPEPVIRKLRTYLRHRENLIRSRGTHTQRMQKCMIQMNIQLHKVISDITGFTGMRIIRSILDGERDPLKLAQLKSSRIRNSADIIAKSLEGNYQEEQLFCLRQEVDQYEYISRKISECEEMIEKTINEMNGDTNDNSDENNDKNNKKNIRTKLHAVCKVDLTEIDGLDINNIETIISEVGVDMNKWPTDKHFGSWLGLSPNSKISGGRILSSKSKKVVNRAATAFRLAAYSAGRSDSSIGAFYRRLRSRMGAPKAITATAYKIARLFYMCMKTGKSYKDLGADYYEKMYKERVLRNFKQKAASLGFSLVPLQI
ncbi:MAG: IS110 family transposase [Spirochaetota bacterium]